MRATLCATDSETDVELPVDEDVSVHVFRDPDRDDEVVAKKDEEVIPLGVVDTTVSRERDKEGNRSSVEFFHEDDQLYVRDTGSSNGVILKNATDEDELPRNEAVPINTDSSVEIGFSTEIEITVRR